MTSLKIFFVLFSILLAIFPQSQNVFAQPSSLIRGRLFFLGVTNDSSRSVWLSLTTAGSFKLEAQGQQLIDEWVLPRRGSHLSLSPIVSQGNGGTHFLINAFNDRKLDSQNQQGGIVFPPFPVEPPVITNPIPPIPSHPIVIPPISPPITNPIPPISAPPISASPGINQPGAVNLPATNVSSTTSANNQALTQNPRRENQVKQKKAPLTNARQLDLESKWNIWSDNRYFDLNDKRHDIDSKGYSSNFTVGADRLLKNQTAVGFLASFIKYRNHALDGLIKNCAWGFNLGPYFATNLTQKWAIDGVFTYGQLKNNNELSILKSNYQTRLFSTALHATGLYTFGNFQLLPKPLISYTHFRNPAYQLNGVLLNIPFQITRPDAVFNFGYLELRAEGNYSKQINQNMLIQPYVELGIDYVFAQPNGGKMLTGNLTLASISKYTGTATFGIRTLIAKAFLIDISSSYLSIGQPKLDAWELRLLASYSFF